MAAAVVLAAISICGIVGTNMLCTTAAQYATNVLSQCQDGNIAEGQWNDPDWCIPVFSSDKL